MTTLPSEPAVSTNNWYGWATGIHNVAVKANTTIGDDGTLYLPQLTADPGVPSVVGEVALYKREDHGVYVLGSTGIRRRLAQQFDASSTLPTNPLPGDAFFHSGLGCLLIYTGTAWRQRDVVTVANATARVAMSTTYVTLMHPGFRVQQTDIGATYQWNTSNAWEWVAGAPEVYSFSYRTPAGGTGPYVDYTGTDNQALRIFKYGRNCFARGCISYGGTYTATAQSVVGVADLPGTPTGLAPAHMVSSTASAWTGSAQSTLMAQVSAAGVLQVVPFTNIASGFIYNFDVQWTSTQ